MEKNTKIYTHFAHDQPGFNGDVSALGRLVSQLLCYRPSSFYVLDGSELHIILSNILLTSRILNSKCSKHFRVVCG